MARKLNRRGEEPIPLRGLSLTWYEVNVVHAAMTRAVETKPSGSVMPTWFDALFKRVDVCKKLNEHAIQHADGT